MLLARSRAALDHPRRHGDRLLHQSLAHILGKKSAAHNFGKVINQIFTGQPSIITRIISRIRRVSRRHHPNEHAQRGGIAHRLRLPGLQLEHAKNTDQRGQNQRDPPTTTENSPVFA